MKHKGQITIIKIGGSVLTKKDHAQKPLLQENVISTIAKELSQYWKSSIQRIVLVHGVGSFAHPLAYKYNLADLKNVKKSPVGVSLTHAAVQDLQGKITKLLLREQLPIFPFSTASMVQQKMGRIKSFNILPIQRLLEKRMIPLLSGDMVVDEATGFSVCSGDQITAYLANMLFAQRVIFLTDVNGIYTADPKRNKDAKIVPILDKKRLLPTLRTSLKLTKKDVTGAIQGKLAEIVTVSAPVIVCNGLQKGNLLKALQGKNPGTLIS